MRNKQSGDEEPLTIFPSDAAVLTPDTARFMRLLEEHPPDYFPFQFLSRLLTESSGSVVYLAPMGLEESLALDACDMASTTFPQLPMGFLGSLTRLRLPRLAPPRHKWFIWRFRGARLDEAKRAVVVSDWGRIAEGERRRRALHCRPVAAQSSLGLGQLLGLAALFAPLAGLAALALLLEAAAAYFSRITQICAIFCIA